MTVTMFKVRPEAEAALLAEIGQWDVYGKFRITDPAQLRDQNLLDEVFCQVLTTQVGEVVNMTEFDVVFEADLNDVAEVMFQDEHLQILVRLMEFNHKDNGRIRNKWTRLRIAIESGDLLATKYRLPLALKSVRTRKWKLDGSNASGTVTINMVAQFQ